MIDPTDTDREATHEDVAELFRLVVAELRRRLDPEAREKLPSAELLAVARKVLKDVRQGPPDEACSKALKGLYRAYLRRLSEALLQTERHPGAALLAEARAFLTWHGCGDAPGAAAGKVAQQLLTADVPFKVTRH